MQSKVLLLLMLLAACGSGNSEAGPSSTVALPETTQTSATSTSALPDLGPVCEPPSFVPTSMPDRVVTQPVEAAAFQSDDYTRIAGTAVAVWVAEDESPVVAFIRGALPPEQWTGEVSRIVVHDVDAAVGPLSDGVWAAAWFEGPDRCDEYTIIVYPPTNRAEVTMVAESLSS